MASGTVGYTDTRGNKDYTSIIANQIGKRLKEASNMASDERAYAAGMAEAGGTSLEEAGIGKGYFFGRALGNRFGGDRIARTKGRMGASGAANNPAASYKQRFRGGFDYNVTNQVSNITDTAPLSNAVVTGLRGVQGGLVQVASAISRQDSTMDGLANTQADMAKAIMFNGYLFQMFMSQQRAKSGRSSAMREERSLEGGGLGGGRGGYGGGFGGGGRRGGGGGGRGMINVTPRGGGGARGIGGAPLKGPDPFDVVSGLSGSVSIGAAKNLATFGPQAGRRIKSALVGEPFMKISNRTILSAMSPGGKLTSGLASLIGGPVVPSIMTAMANPKAAEVGISQGFDLINLAVNSGEITSDAGKRMTQALRGSNAGKMDIMSEMLDAQARYMRRAGRITEKGQGVFQDILGGALDIEDTKHLNAFTGMSVGGKKIGKKQARFLDNLGLSAGLISPVTGRAKKGSRNIGGIVDDIMKYYPNTNFKSIEEAVALTQFARNMDVGMKPRHAIGAVRDLMGKEVADKALVHAGETAMKNTKVAKELAKMAGRTAMWKSISKKIPVISAFAGTFFALQRAMEGDFKGAGLEFSSGMLGLMPGFGQGLGFGIDGYLLARDMGIVPMRTGGKMSGFAANSLLSVNGMPLASFNEPGNPESIVVERDNEDRFVDMGMGIVDGFKKRKGDYTALQAIGVERGFSSLNAEGFFSGLFKNTKDVVNNVKNPFSGIMNWFNKGAKPNEGAMSWIDLLKDDWKQRQFTKGPGKGGWNPFRGMPGYGSIKNFLTGTPGNEIAGGFQTGPTPAIRQGILRTFGLLTNPKAAIMAALMKPTALADGTLTGNADYLNSVGMDTANLQGGLGAAGVTGTVINNNNYYTQGPSADGGGSDENLGQSFNMDLEKFITSYSIMSK